MTITMLLKNTLRTLSRGRSAFRYSKYDSVRSCACGYGQVFLASFSLLPTPHRPQSGESVLSPVCPVSSPQSLPQRRRNRRGRKRRINIKYK